MLQSVCSPSSLHTCTTRWTTAYQTGWHLYWVYTSLPFCCTPSWSYYWMTTHIYILKTVLDLPPVCACCCLLHNHTLSHPVIREKLLLSSGFLIELSQQQLHDWFHCLFMLPDSIVTKQPPSPVGRCIYKSAFKCCPIILTRVLFLTKEQISITITWNDAEEQNRFCQCQCQCYCQIWKLFNPV